MPLSPCEQSPEHEIGSAWPSIQIQFEWSSIWLTGLVFLLSECSVCTQLLGWLSINSKGDMDAGRIIVLLTTPANLLPVTNMSNFTVVWSAVPVSVPLFCWLTLLALPKQTHFCRIFHRDGGYLRGMCALLHYLPTLLMIPYPLLAGLRVG